MKECTNCAKEKKHDEFYKKKKGRLTSWCKECIREKNRKRYHRTKNKETKKKSEPEYFPKKYVKSNSKYSSTTFWYRKAKHCYCSEISNRSCAYCGLKEERLSKHLRENEEGFWDENNITGISESEFKRKIKEHGAEIIS